MRIALVSEGTYPFAGGGVSLWCDQLIRGLPEHEWEVVAITVDGTERPCWERPPNVVGLRSVPLWGPHRGGARKARLGSEMHAALGDLLDAVLAPEGPAAVRQVNRSRFLRALRRMHEYATDGGDLAAALTSEVALATTVEAWRVQRPDEPPITLADAVTGLASIEHLLRPLSATTVRADIVHSSMNGPSMLVAMAAKWRYGTPVVMSEHGMYLRERYLADLDEELPHPVRVLVLGFHRQLARGAYAMADEMAPHGLYNRRWQLHSGADPDRVWTVYNGVEPDEFTIPGSEPAEPTIVFLGRIDPIKDLHTLIRAFALVRAELPQARLRIYGDLATADADYVKSCRDLVEKLGLDGPAVFEGRAGRPVDAYHRAHVVALTSISEGFPYTVVEAMACGLPVVCTDVGGVVEAVGDAGFMVPPRDHAAVARACLRLLGDASLRARLGDAARARVLAHFTLEQSIDAYRRVYLRLAAVAALRPAAVEPPTPVYITGRARVTGPSRLAGAV